MMDYCTNNIRFIEKENWLNYEQSYLKILVKVKQYQVHIAFIFLNSQETWLLDLKN